MLAAMLCVLCPQLEKACLRMEFLVIEVPFHIVVLERGSNVVWLIQQTSILFSIVIPVTKYGSRKVTVRNYEILFIMRPYNVMRRT